MSALAARALVPFVPGGKDFAASRRLFAALGFTELWENSGFAGFSNGGVQFILQDYDNEAFSHNLMLKLIVPSLDEWWAEVSSRNLGAAFPGFRANGPKDFPWGREVHFIDLAGVCWHVGEA